MPLDDTMCVCIVRNNDGKLIDDINKNALKIDLMSLEEVKKMSKIIFVMLLCIVAITGCGESSPKETRIELNSTNFEEYFSIDAQVVDLKSEKKDAGFTKTTTATATIKVNVIPKKEFKTEDVKFDMMLSLMGYCWTNYNDDFSVYVYPDGKGEATHYAIGDCGWFNASKPTISKFLMPEQIQKVQDSNGQAFFYGDRQYLLGNLKGSIIIKK